MDQATLIGTGVQTLVALLVCGIMGLLGQGVRAVVGLKNAAATQAAAPDRQSEFNAAYLLVSLMIGFIAGILAGLVMGLQDFTTAITVGKLMGIAAAGYAGADFVENAMSIVVPKGTQDAGLPKGTQDSGLPKGAAVAFVASSAPAVATAPTPLATALHATAPGVDVGRWLAPLTKAFTTFGLDTDQRRAAAMGQFLVEAGPDLAERTEDLYYTHADAVLRAFGSHFSDAAAAEPFLRNPAALANRVYANRLGNGDEASGDGYRYRGRGLIQLTGKDNYAGFAASIQQTVEAAADYCETEEGAALSGCWYLSSRHCLPLADAWDIDGITRLVNPAMLGRSQRLAYANRILQALQHPA